MENDGRERIGLRLDMSTTLSPSLQNFQSYREIVTIARFIN